ncbi:PepSY domain-containing protein [Asaia krungthepensis]|uniref:PepSY-associated TM helix domain-containing protein n=1 Tax=Asaia krungthepensis NRIC 0535 TaxID=1307925 RepID=A0ABQ0Q1W6_9PROT|nr:PepSY domain-containing protein [Asaia krungthepensis]GBQ87446.1 PepSY-associated TM helix domain-containing protein [Asaia krungthepensis NRIC 0535]
MAAPSSSLKRRKRIVRLAFLMHRWLGITVGTMMILWCLSGMVMLWQAWPVPDPAASRMAHGVIDLRIAPVFPRLHEAYRSFRLTMAGRVPLLQTVTLQGLTTSHDLRDGRIVMASSGAGSDARDTGSSSLLSPDDVLDDARRYALATGDQGVLTFRGIKRDDQWIMNTKGRETGFYRYDSDSTSGSILYLSPLTGDVVQATTRQSRFWAWVGAIPHWLYPSLLRRHAQLWSNVLIVLSGAGIVLTLLGLWIGWRRLNTGRHISPYRHIHYLHHIAGLAFGPLLLSWIVTGFLTMNPGGFLARRDAPDWTTKLYTALPDDMPDTVMASLSAHPDRHFRDLRAASLGGHPFLVGTNADGTTQRLNSHLDPFPLTQNAVEAAVRETGLQGVVTKLERDDRFYFSTRHVTRSFPVYRVTGSDGVQLYLDGQSGLPLLVVDGAARGSRWIIYGPHDFDFFPWLRLPLTRLILVFPVLLSVTLVSLAGGVIGLRRLIRRRGPSGTRHNRKATTPPAGDKKHS